MARMIKMDRLIMTAHHSSTVEEMSNCYLYLITYWNSIFVLSDMKETPEN